MLETNLRLLVFLHAGPSYLPLRHSSRFARDSSFLLLSEKRKVECSTVSQPLDIVKNTAVFT